MSTVSHISPLLSPTGCKIKQSYLRSVLLKDARVDDAFDPAVNQSKNFIMSGMRYNFNVVKRGMALFLRFPHRRANERRGKRKNKNKTIF